MRSNPVRRIFAWFGLAALASIGYMVFSRQMDVFDGGMKALLVFIAVIVAVRFVEFGLGGVASALERRPPAPMPGQQVERRR
jgi:hypothetical protein